MADQALSNPGRLDGLVRDCLDLAAARPAPEAARFLRTNAARLERRLRTLSSWASTPGSVCPVALDGLTAFDLAEAMDALNAAARRREPVHDR